MSNELIEEYLSHRTLLLRGETTIDQQEKLCGELELLALRSTEPVLLLIDTLGGDRVASRLLFDAIRFSCAPVHAEVLKAESAGFTVLQACKIRRARPNASLSFHGGTTRIIGDKPRALHELQAEQQWHEDFLRFLAQRSGQPLEELRELSQHEASFLPDEALQRGFIDEILPPPVATL